MIQLAQNLKIPGFDSNPILPPPNLNQQFLNSPANGGGLGYFVSGLYNVAFLITGSLLLIWLVWGIFQYIFAGGNKELLAKARSRIVWALIGFLIVVTALFVSQYAQTLFNANDFYKNFNKVQEITP